jgi:hypothetical protein
VNEMEARIFVESSAYRAELSAARQSLAVFGLPQLHSAPVLESLREGRARCGSRVRAASPECATRPALDLYATPELHQTNRQCWLSRSAGLLNLSVSKFKLLMSKQLELQF